VWFQPTTRKFLLRSQPRNCENLTLVAGRRKHLQEKVLYYTRIRFSGAPKPQNQTKIHFRLWSAESKKDLLLFLYYKDIKQEIVHTFLSEEYGVSKKWVIIMDKRQVSHVTSTSAGKSGPLAQDRPMWLCQKFMKRCKETTLKRKRIETILVIVTVTLHLLKYLVSCKLFWIELLVCNLYVKRFDLTKGLLFDTLFNTVWYKLCSCKHSILEITWKKCTEGRMFWWIEMRCRQDLSNKLLLRPDFLTDSWLVVCPIIDVVCNSFFTNHSSESSCLINWFYWLLLLETVV